MEPVENVALLALTYRELAKPPYPGADGIVDDLEQAPGEVSLLRMIGAQAAREEDWALVAVMEDGEPLATFAEELAAWDPLRCEALLHACPTDPRADLVGHRWAEPYLVRWELIGAAMAGLRDLGLTTAREDVNAVAHEAYAVATGRPLADVEQEWDDWDAAD